VRSTPSVYLTGMTKTADIIDDLSDAVVDVLVKNEIPRTGEGVKYAALSLLHLVGIMVTEDLPQPAGVHKQLCAFLAAHLRKDADGAMALAKEMLGDALVDVTPSAGMVPTA
jgi:hypothetical protein